MKTQFTWLAAGTAIGAVFVSLGACGGGDTFFAADDGGGGNDVTTNPNADGGGDDTTSPLPDGAPPPADAPVDVGPDTTPPIPPEDCTVVPVGTFASLSGAGNTTGCDNPATPCGTISAAIAWAMNHSTTIYVDKGTYPEQLDLKLTNNVPSITIQGGWEKTPSGWKQICDGTQVQSVHVYAPSDKNVTVLAQDIGGAVTLDTINIGSRVSPPAAAGESIYGILATGATTKLTLKGVGITVAKGGDGTAGGPGGTGAAGAASCAAGIGGTPAAGGPGAGATTGGFSTTGYQTPAGSTGGSQGGIGGNGTAPAGQCSSAPVTCIDCGTDPGPPILHCVDIGQSTAMVCGGPGVPGCGSGGGAGGSPGTSGGSSIGLFAWGASIDVSYAVLTSAAGGTGGAGGAGGPAGTPTPGAAGTPFLCVDTCTLQANNQCKQTGTTYNAGVGTGGSPGSAGGQGGGGAGGYSYAYYTGGGATLTAGVNVSYNHGAPGGAGAGGNPAAAAGMAGDHN